MRSTARLRVATVGHLLCLGLLAGGMAAAGRAADGKTAGELWSLRPVAAVEPPAVRHADWVQTPIDRFILARLEARGWQPASRASRAQLIRRAYFDLWGLPPAPENVRAFVADERPDAFERLVEALLASPRFGERWARYWLDLVRFAETNGYERDALKPNAWRYRDWVIAAINDDMPYDRFVTEQLAGDELPGAGEAARVATGFLRVGTFDDEPNDPLQYKFEQLDDLVHATSTAFLAVTLKCARCHDHKFDPIPQTDYYAVLNFFIGGQPAAGELLAYTDAGPNPPPVHLLAAGDPRQAGAVVPAGYLSMVPALDRPLERARADAPTSVRRLQLARWITDRQHPLTARVMVNRLWQHHFGAGLVRTPDNFGTTGSEPTHPELLDYLAGELVAGGWRLKRLHKLLLLSAAYQMDSTHPREAEYGGADFANALWWKRNRLRLECEALRDAMLAAGGQLNLRAGGPSFFPPLPSEALEGLSKKTEAWGASPPAEQRRRSIYMMTKRSLLSPLMTTFDFADTTQPCSQRAVSTVAPQALALLNNEFVHAQSRALAERVGREAGDEPVRQVERAWWLALSRPPSADELRGALDHLKARRREPGTIDGQSVAPESAEAAARALASLCHVLVNLNEFIYVD